jgi:hypothetical protein
MTPKTFESQGVFETGDDAVHHALDRLGARLGKKIPRRASAFAVLGSILAIVASTLAAQSPVGSKSRAQNPVLTHPSPSTSAGVNHPLVGKGPFVVWTNSQDESSRVGIYGLDLSAVGSGVQLVADAQMTLFRGFPSSRQALPWLPIAANEIGSGALLRISRDGLTEIARGLSFSENTGPPLVSSNGVEMAVLLNTGGNRYSIRILDLNARETREIPFSVPSALEGTGTGSGPFVPHLFRWYLGDTRFLILLTNGGPDAPLYSMNLQGKLDAMSWLGNRSLIDGGPVGDSSQFVFDPAHPHQLAVADLVHRTTRVIAHSIEDYQQPVATPDGSLAAYARTTIGPSVEILRMSNGHVVINGLFEAASIIPLAWVNDSRLLALAQSPDLVTGRGTQALLMLDIPTYPGEPYFHFRVLATGGEDLNYVGLLR